MQPDSEHATPSSDLVARAIAQTRPLEDAAGTVWVAFSGGLDSTVLLHAMRGIAGVAATHIDHGLHPQSGAWAEHCARVASGFGARFEARSVRVAADGNREHAARTARYALWRELLQPGDVLALAHHANDQAETRLWQLLTGREPSGMPAERPLAPGILLVRPFIRIPRAALEQYARRHRLQWLEDPSNADESLDRNYIRERLMPRIEARFPDALRRMSRPRPPPLVPAPLPVAQTSPATVSTWLLRAGLPVSRAAVAEIGRQTATGQDRVPQVRVAPGVRAWRHAGCWHLVRDLPTLAEQCLAVGRATSTPLGALAWRRAARGLPSGLPVTMRSRQGGERIRPDARNVTKSVKALLREAKVPPWRRDRWPLLYAESSRGLRLAAVAGLAVSAEAAVADGWQPLWTPVADY